MEQTTLKSKKHLFWMILCCLAVIAAIIILPKYFNIGAIGYILLMLLCPVLHYFLMSKMHKTEKCNEINETRKNKIQK